jgi:hypothetical protein
VNPTRATGWVVADGMKAGTWWVPVTRLGAYQATPATLSDFSRGASPIRPALLTRIYLVTVRINRKSFPVNAKPVMLLVLPQLSLMIKIVATV